MGLQVLHSRAALQRTSLTNALLASSIASVLMSFHSVVFHCPNCRSHSTTVSHTSFAMPSSALTSVMRLRASVAASAKSKVLARWWCSVSSFSKAASSWACRSDKCVFKAETLVRTL